MGRPRDCYKGQSPRRPGRNASATFDVGELTGDFIRCQNDESVVFSNLRRIFQGDLEFAGEDRGAFDFHGGGDRFVIKVKTENTSCGQIEVAMNQDFRCEVGGVHREARIAVAPVTRQG